MPRRTAALGPAAVTQAMHILSQARPFTVEPEGWNLQPGAMGDGNTVLLSANARTVLYAVGDALFEEDLAGFLTHTYSPGWTRPVWMDSISPAQNAFVFSLAQSLTPWWGPRGSVAAWLTQFGAYYCSHRGEIELAGRHALLLLEGLYGLRPLWSGLFDALTGSMGEQAPQVFGRWVGIGDVAPFLGILIGAQGEHRISVEGVHGAIAALRQQPTDEFETCMSLAIYPMLLRRAEDASRNLAPVVDRLRREL